MQEAVKSECSRFLSNYLTSHPSFEFTFFGVVHCLQLEEESLAAVCLDTIPRLCKTCSLSGVTFPDHVNLFWGLRRLFRASGSHPNRSGEKLCLENVVFGLQQPSGRGSQAVPFPTQQSLTLEEDVLRISLQISSFDHRHLPNAPPTPTPQRRRAYGSAHGQQTSPHTSTSLELCIIKRLILRMKISFNSYFHRNLDWI